MRDVLVPAPVTPTRSECQRGQLGGLWRDTTDGVLVQFATAREMEAAGDSTFMVTHIYSDSTGQACLKWRLYCTFTFKQIRLRTTATPPTTNPVSACYCLLTCSVPPKWCTISVYCWPCVLRILKIHANALLVFDFFILAPQIKPMKRLGMFLEPLSKVPATRISKQGMYIHQEDHRWSLLSESVMPDEQIQEVS